MKQIRLPQPATQFDRDLVFQLTKYLMELQIQLDQQLERIKTLEAQVEALTP